MLLSDFNFREILSRYMDYWVHCFCVQGIMSRVYETVAVLFLLAILICGLAGILSALLNSDKAERKALFGEY